jgi:hypothetical protein
MNTGAAPAVKSQNVAGMSAPTAANSQGAKPLLAALQKQAMERR